MAPDEPGAPPNGDARERQDTAPDGLPVRPTDDVVTTARCSYCGGEAIKGGPIVPDEAMVRDRWEICAFGPSWAWCWRQRRWLHRE